MPLLNPGDEFPAIDLNLVGGESLSIPDALHGTFGVVLFNRGAWCPYCSGQLRGFERAHDALVEAGGEVVSLSVDDEATTAALIEKLGLSFPVGHSADARKLAGLTGAFVSHEPVHLQATGFVLDPTGHVVVSTYSSGAIGRITAEDTVGLINYVKSHSG